jgi:hypothetical protein
VIEQRVERWVHKLFGREMKWKLVTTLSGMFGAMIAEKLLKAGYDAVTKGKGPASPFDPRDARFRRFDALRWSVAGGIGLGVAKVVSARVAAIGWKAATGTLPPGAGEQPTVA